MVALITQLLNAIQFHIPELTLLLLLYLGVKLSPRVLKCIPETILNKIPKLSLARSLLICSLLSLLLISYIFVLHNRYSDKVLIKDYTFIENPGYYTHKSKGGHYCPRCLLSGIPSQFYIYDKYYYRCSKCNREIQIDKIISQTH